MTVSRRQFLKGSGLAAAGGLLAPSLFRNRFVEEALASTIGDRYLVVIFLDGGNDGLNTVTPVGNGGGSLRADYEAARNHIRLTPDHLASTMIGTDPNTGAQLALHPGFAGTGPGMGGFKALWDEGKLAVVQGCGYPDYSLSHEESRLVWQTGNPARTGPYSGSGWMGRFLGHPSQYGGSDIPGVSIGDAVAGEYKQNATSVLAIRRLRDFGFPYDPFVDDSDLKRAAFEALYQSAAATAQPTFSYVGNSGGATLLSAESYPLLHSLYETDRQAESQWYDDVGRGAARDLKEVAKMIYGVATGQPNVSSRFFHVANGGYDTHSDQGGATGQHHDLHKEIGDSVRVFLKDLETMPGNVADKTVVVVWSEFSRRIEENQNGTDHGSQGPMFVVGGSVIGGVYGNHPNIAPAAQDDQGNTVYTQSANPFRSTDFRDVYGTILKHWLNMPEGTILSNVLAPDVGDPALYWTAPNLDLGFV